MTKAKIFFKVLPWLILCIILTYLTLGGFGVYFLYRDVKTTNENNIDILASAIASSTDSDLSHPKMLHETLSKLAKRLDMPEVLLTDREGQVVADTFKSSIPSELLLYAKQVAAEKSSGQNTRPDGQIISQDIKINSGHAIMSSLPIKKGTSEYLMFSVVNDSRFYSKLKGLALQYSVASFLSLLSICLLLYFIAGYIVRALNKLSHYTQPDQSCVDGQGEVALVPNKVPNKYILSGLVEDIRSIRRADAEIVSLSRNNLKEAQEGFRDALDLSSAIINSVIDAMVIINANGTIKNCNKAFYQLLGLGSMRDDEHIDIILGFSAPEDLHNIDGDLMDVNLYVNPDHGCSGLSELFEFCELDSNKYPSKIYTGKLINANSTEYWVEIYMACQVVKGDMIRFCLIHNISAQREAEDILRKANDDLEKIIGEHTRELVRANSQLRIENAERKTIELALRRTEARYRDIFESSMEGIFQYTPNGRFISANPALAKMLDFESVDELLASSANKTFRLFFDEEEGKEIVSLLEERGQVRHHEFKAKNKEGEFLWVTINARRVSIGDTATLYYEGFLTDITERKHYEEQLLHQAFHDPLTGLPNRALFRDRLSMALKRAGRDDRMNFAVLYLDLDRFKLINDSLGHGVGDMLLCHVAEQLQASVRDIDTVARFGGDEFGILLDNLLYPNYTVVVARRIQEALSKSLNIEGHDVVTAASIGIVFNNPSYTDPGEVLRDADTAMYRAKAKGTSTFKVFNSRMRHETIRLISLETDLRRAIDRGELFMDYQPVVSLKGRSLHGFEALIRWKRNNRIISPSEFIPIAEDTGLIVEIGRHTLQMVCQQVVQWKTAMPDSFSLVHINISGKQLMQNNLVRDIESMFSLYNVNPDWLRFEITESILLHHGSLAMNLMRQLRDMGIRLCLDDFGTGYSSLSYLKSLPVDSLKVDRSFIIDIEHNQESLAIVRTILSLGEHLGLEVVVEGIETENQAEILLDVGCEYAQGFLFAPPKNVIIATDILGTGLGVEHGTSFAV